MRLKDNKTGVIKDWTFPEWLRYIMNPDDSSHGSCDLEQFIKNVDTFSQRWKKCEEHEEHEYFWYISPTGTPIKSEVSIYDPLEIHLMKQIGNYFESEADADKAVEKLVALKRLEDHNLRVEMGQRLFVNADNKLTSQKPLFVVDTYAEVEDDLDSLFCNEDDYEPTNAEINDLTDMGYGR